MSELVLNRSTAPQVLRLFDCCFKRGVLDSIYLGDDYAAKEFLEARLADGGYGLVYDTEDFDWKRWRFTISRIARENRLGRLEEDYISSSALRQSGRTFLFALLPISMRFYLMGVEEWLAYPNPGHRALFTATSVHWKPMASPLRKIKTNDWISYVQEFVYERQKMRIENDLTPLQYDSFAEAMWKFTRKYAHIPTKKKV